jgi:integrase
VSRFPFGYDSKKSKKNEDNGKDEERHRSRSGSSTSAPTTCAKLCWKSGGDVEQIKFLLGHSSIQTTERYLGSEQDIEIAVNDNLGL